MYTSTFCSSKPVTGYKTYVFKTNMPPGYDIDYMMKCFQHNNFVNTRHRINLYVPITNRLTGYQYWIFSDQ